MNSLKQEIKDLKQLQKWLKKIEFEMTELRMDENTVEPYEFEKYNFTIINQHKFYKKGIEAVKKHIEYKIADLPEDDKEVIGLRIVQG